ncbi:transposase [Frankia sp. Mgl5]|uniref:transposase n=1 Tax=Frankia sp. Mgl5 TaxID=2933793 RepID=UPI0034D7026E
MPAPRKYPDELRERSVRLVQQMRREQPAEASRAISTVAKRLDVHPATLRLWVKSGRGRPGDSSGNHHAGRGAYRRAGTREPRAEARERVFYLQNETDIVAEV